MKHRFFSFLSFRFFLAGVLLAGATAALAQAQPGDRERVQDAGRQQRDTRYELPPPRQMDRLGDERGGFSHLTPDERQQLRRDIREHGRDVYHSRRERR